MDSSTHSNEISQSQKLSPEQIIQRRRFLKWGLIGGLVVLPIATSIYRRLRRNIYKYTYEGPFVQYRMPPEGWKGNRKGKSYVPRALIALDDPNEDKFSLSADFHVAETAPDNTAIIKMEIFSHHKVVNATTAKWIVPKNREVNIDKIWAAIWTVDPNREVPFNPEKSITVRTKRSGYSLSDVTKIVVTIEEFLMEE